LGVEYAWIEPAAQNYYRHTFLKRLVQSYPESRWGKFYREIYARTGFEEIPVEGEAGAAEEIRDSGRMRSTVRFLGEISRGQVFERYFGPGFHFRLEPRPFGWVTLCDPFCIKHSAGRSLDLGVHRICEKSEGLGKTRFRESYSMDRLIAQVFGIVRDLLPFEAFP